MGCILWSDSFIELIAAKEKLEIVIRAAPRLRRGFGGQASHFGFSRGDFPACRQAGSPPQAVKAVRTNSRILHKKGFALCANPLKI